MDMPVLMFHLCFLGLKYYEDLIHPVPKAEASEIRDVVMREVRGTQPGNGMCFISVVFSVLDLKPYKLIMSSHIIA